jgi:CRISPR-associated protein Cmr1
LLRLRLTKDENGGNGWESGKLTAWPVGGQTEFHREVGEQGRQVGAELYLGYGPLGVQAGQTVLNNIRDSDKQRTAIDEKAHGWLRLMYPEAYENELQAAMQLAAWFGTLGSRSRNGWGALQLTNEHLKPLNRANLEYLNVEFPFSECLHLEWPHAIGRVEDRPLVWKTRVTGNWREVMRELARIKIKFRTDLCIENNCEQLGPVEGGVRRLRQDLLTSEKRHVLAYPVTNHGLRNWGVTKQKNRNGQREEFFAQEERLANQLRFKVAKAADGKLEGVIVHLPCKVPDELVRKLAPPDQQFIRRNELPVWQAVHAVLDQHATRLA